MEGLIPFVYRAIVQYKSGGGQAGAGSSWFSESPSASYMRLPTGDSGRFQPSEIQLFRPDRVFSSSSSSSMVAASSTTSHHHLLSTATQSPLRRSSSRRLVS
ncbi:hypothetical protein BVC80_1835g169 [Macleaya cordata]|uniref:Uncharacterized protein n=1 Tax=Macleaya cordata TaxID=56857 RepID=A0A200R4Y4_MACCD|nr:hypothetical protein BVC80_1835g169 [Macleaya cordata]